RPAILVLVCSSSISSITRTSTSRTPMFPAQRSARSLRQRSYQYPGLIPRGRRISEIDPGQGHFDVLICNQCDETPVHRGFLFWSHSVPSPLLSRSSPAPALLPPSPAQ